MKTILIQFDEKDEPTIFINGETDVETKKLLKIAEKIKKTLKGPDDED